MFHSVACCCPCVVLNVEVSCAQPAAMFCGCQLHQSGSVSFAAVDRTWNVLGIKCAPKGVWGGTGQQPSQQIVVKEIL
jgi:hypothetical protein